MKIMMQFSRDNDNSLYWKMRLFKTRIKNNVIIFFEILEDHLIKEFKSKCENNGYRVVESYCSKSLYVYWNRVLVTRVSDHENRNFYDKEIINKRMVTSVFKAYNYIF